jgi:hypothetical protein
MEWVGYRPWVKSVCSEYLTYCRSFAAPLTFITTDEDRGLSKANAKAGGAISCRISDRETLAKVPTGESLFPTSYADLKC